MSVSKRLEISKETDCDKDGKKAEYKWSDESTSIENTVDSKKKFILSNITVEGRYEVYCAWDGKGAGAHVFIIEKQANGNII